MIFLVIAIEEVRVQNKNDISSNRGGDGAKSERF
jgi:hypothetical protein